MFALRGLSGPGRSFGRLPASSKKTAKMPVDGASKALSRLRNLV
jgi:hypothetical protein